MSHELFYTSAPKGLRPGSRGFCTVAATQGLPLPLAEKVESLSGYRPLYPPLDAKGNQNPVVHSHLRITVGGKTYSVLSRISPAGLDYSQRANKFAHHVILEAGELPARGPAWLLGQPGFMESQWDGEVRVMPSGRLPPAGDAAPSVCRAWREVTGDAGWGGILADWFERDPNRQVYLLFEPGLDLLPLIAETVALLPIERRWQVSFSTYFTGLPQGIPCLWRCVVKDSPEAGNASRLPGQQVLNLCELSGQAPAGEFVNLARGNRKSAPIGARQEQEALSDWPDDSDIDLKREGRLISRKSSPYGSSEASRSHARSGGKASPVTFSEALPAVAHQIVPPPSPPSRRTKPWRPWISLTALICGVGLGVFFSTVYFRPNFITGDDSDNLAILDQGPIASKSEDDVQKPKLDPKVDVPNQRDKTEAQRKETFLLEDLKQKVGEKEKENAKLKKENESISEERVRQEKRLEVVQRNLQENDKKIGNLSEKTSRQEKKIKELQEELDNEKEKNRPKFAHMVDKPFALPPWAKSDQGSKKGELLRLKDLDLQPDAGYRLELLGIDTERLLVTEDKGLLQVKLKQKEDGDLATFKIEGENLSFEWHPHKSEKHERGQLLLRDSVLRISGPKPDKYLSLREPLKIHERDRDCRFSSQRVCELFKTDFQGKPTKKIEFDSIELEIENEVCSTSAETRFPFETLKLIPIGKRFSYGTDNRQGELRWVLLEKSQNKDYLASLSIGTDIPPRELPKIRIISLVAYMEVSGLFVEVARIEKPPR
jgi:hypothetical protein